MKVERLTLWVARLWVTILFAQMETWSIFSLTVNVVSLNNEVREDDKVNFE